ncbi:MAG: tRNA lysidine(34) synthetase TilS [Gammaproteobacteria bacterium]|nr:MAG: tRNA lysidine(34) synthetase TilS [Gammaproteobacteria bacterium]
MSFSISLLQRFFSSYQYIEKFYIAYSGGLDSTVLLHAMHAAKLPIHAVHVNHHLQQDSDGWQQHCAAVCNGLGVSLTVKHAQINKSPQKSLEDCARDARYALLEEMLDVNSAMVTAHHQDDLAETVLLQLLRGAGPAGLAAMPTDKKLSIGIHLRPMLASARAELLEYARSSNLQWVEDPSNEFNDFDRNYLRNQVMPKLIERWPGANQTLSRSSTLQADALSCLSDLAEIDIQPARTTQVLKLDVRALQVLSSERLNNVLRYWIQSNHMRVPSMKVLQQIVSDIVLKKEIETSPLQSWKEGEIRRFRNCVYLMQPLKPHDANQVIRWNIDQPLYIESLDRTLQPKDLKDAGVPFPDGVNELIVRFRAGGERLKPFGSKQHRSLKNLLQEGGIPPWERARIPLLFHQEQLISVLGYWNIGRDCETTS